MKIDFGLSLDEMVVRMMAIGYGEQLSKDIAETASVVFEHALDEPVSRRYIGIHLQLLENRSKRHWKEMEKRLMARLEALEKGL